MLRLLKYRWWVSGLACLAGLSAIPALAQESNFGSVNLSPGFANAQGMLQGFTQGSFSLSAIANRDRSDNLCLGYADSTPDHIMTLDRDFSQLSLQVVSGGDTTLVVQGPNNTVRCGDDTGRNKDASVSDTDWQAGTYRIWVGSFEQGTRHDYTLRIRE